MTDRVRSLRVPASVVTAANDMDDRGLKPPDEAAIAGSGDKLEYKWTEALKIVNTKITTDDVGRAKIEIQTKVTPNSPFKRNLGKMHTVWYLMLQGDALASADLTVGQGMMSLITVANCRQLIKAAGFDPGPLDQFDIAEWFEAADGEAKPLVGSEVFGRMSNKVDTYRFSKSGLNEDGSKPRRTEVAMWAAANG